MQLIITAHWEEDGDPTLYVSDISAPPNVIEALKREIEKLSTKPARQNL